VKEEILCFWFDEPSGREPVSPDRQQMWFGKNPRIDQSIRERFEANVMAAARGDYEHWRAEPEGTLALILLLDQFPRNMYRDSARAYAFDEQALKICLEGIRAGRDRPLRIVERAFFYLPMEHAENIKMQERSVRAFEALCKDAPESMKETCRGFLEYAHRHRAIISRFGRFPHRNSALGRRTTPEEETFLKEPGSSF